MGTGKLPQLLSHAIGTDRFKSEMDRGKLKRQNFLNENYQSKRKMILMTVTIFLIIQQKTPVFKKLKCLFSEPKKMTSKM